MIDPVLSRRLVATGIVQAQLKVLRQCALDLLTPLGLREVAGRGRSGVACDVSDEPLTAINRSKLETEPIARAHLARDVQRALLNCHAGRCDRPRPFPHHMAVAVEVSAGDWEHD